MRVNPVVNALVPTMVLCAIPTLLRAQSSPPPTITAINTAYGGQLLAPNTWVEIHGTHLTPTSTPPGGMFWSSAPEFASGQMPRKLGGVSVTFDGIPGYIWWFCSAATTPTCKTDQINVLTPVSSDIGINYITVNNGTASTSGFDQVRIDSKSPSLLLFDSYHVTAVHASGGFIGPTTLFPGQSTPAKPGETIQVYATGFGLPASPLVEGSSHQLAALAQLPLCYFDQTLEPTTQAAFLISPGLYQLNLKVPNGTDDGEHRVSCHYLGVDTNTTNFGQAVTYITVSSQPTPPPAGGGQFQLQGKAFVLNGKMAVGSNTVNAELQATPSGSGHTVVFDDNLSAASGITITFVLGQTIPSVTGNTVVFTGSPSVGVYSDFSNPSKGYLASISLVTMTLNFASYTNGAAVTGTISFVTSNGTFQDSFTGSLSSVI